MTPRAPRSLPILAADAVALNIREGRQSQHRQPMRWQPVFHEEGNGFCLFSGNRHPRHSKYYNNPEHFRQGAAEDFAPWRVGDSLYVREAWALIHVFIDPETGWGDDIEEWEGRAPKKRPQEYWKMVYRAGRDWPATVEQRGFRWRPNILCPEWAARTTTKPLVRVWAERVQDISEEDARAEGVTGPGPGVVLETGALGYSVLDIGTFATARDAFRVLWEVLYPGSWERNDWVWCCAWDGVEVRS